MGERFEFQTKSGVECAFRECWLDEMYFFNADLLGRKDVPLLEVMGDMMAYSDHFTDGEAKTKQIRTALLKEWKAGRLLPKGYIVYEVDKEWFMKYEVLSDGSDFDSSDDDGTFSFTEMPDDYYPED